MIIDNRQSDLPLDPAGVVAIAETVLTLEGESADEVGVHFVSGDEISKLHADYFDDPSLTDCISLPVEGGAPYRLLGDVIVCPQVALHYVDEEGGDPYRETTLYLVHGLLHLLGYDDKGEEKCKLMRLAEKRAMAHLEKKGLMLKGYMFTRGRVFPRERGLQRSQLKGGAHSISYGRRLQAGRLAAPAPRGALHPLNLKGGADDHHG